jgi:hypothetical protein
MKTRVDEWVRVMVEIGLARGDGRPGHRMPILYLCVLVWEGHREMSPCKRRGVSRDKLLAVLIGRLLCERLLCPIVASIRAESKW